ncbi:MAG: Gfo/Idh/MocA family protein, partial [Planctomycetaceae bacterium]
MKTFRTAVIGTGFIGPVHVEALWRTGVVVAAIVGSSPQKSQAAARRLGIDPKHGSLPEGLADDSIDAVHLTTPNRFHFEQAREVLSAGKHVLCEKPLAMNSRESAELTRLAADSGLAV